MIISTEPPIYSLDPKAGKDTPYRMIYVGKGRYCYIDSEDYLYLSQFRWTVRMSHSRPYVIRRVRTSGVERQIRMHREIMQTPKGMHCHHIAFYTYDMRKSQLQNLAPHHHNALHAERRLRLVDRPSLRRASDLPILAMASNLANKGGIPSEKK